MKTWNVFYDSNKFIHWTVDNGVTPAIIQEQAELGLSHITVEQDDVLDANRYYVNDDEDGVILKSTFNPTISTYSPALETPLSITGIPTGTQVWIDDVLKTTMSDTTLNLTFNDPGQFEIIFKKVGYFDYGFEVLTARAS